MPKVFQRLLFAAYRNLCGPECLRNAECCKAEKRFEERNLTLTGQSIPAIIFDEIEQSRCSYYITS